MMRKRIVNGKIALGVALLFFSALFYFISYESFHNGRYIVQAILNNVAFAFFEVFLVTLIINRLLMIREKKALHKKLNMIIGVFFNETGTELIQKCMAFDRKAPELVTRLVVTNDWSEKEFAVVVKALKKHDASIDYHKGDIEGLKSYLLAHRAFLLNLLENQSLLEHDSFSNLLWAAFHLTDELSRRKDLRALSQVDQQHVCVDIKRALALITSEWLAHMKHLKIEYPYLFSLAMRTNPFDPRAKVELE